MAQPSCVDQKKCVDQRSCGVLLHISSLPSPYGIGDLGPQAHAFAETLAAAGLKHWQFLPLTPTSTFIGNSPYSSPSAFAGNPLFISPEILLADGLITHAELEAASYRYLQDQNPARVNYEAVSAQREYLLNLAFERRTGACHSDSSARALLPVSSLLPLSARPPLQEDPSFCAFVRENSYWLDDYALFAAIKASFGGQSWIDWPESLKRRDPHALASWRASNASAVLRQQFIQYLFAAQWASLHKHCAELGIKLIGDLPIYVTHDSADVWSRPDLFKLDAQGQPLAVSGVPPDYFSPTGQRWGNPVYAWDKMRAENFAWWIKRLEYNLSLVDTLRLDHFRGFCAYWEIPADEATAINGKWVPAPGREFLAALRARFGELPLIAEDLGVITPDVRALMAEFDLPGMKVLQFAFGGDPAQSPDVPYRHPRRSVVYTGTHDNQTGKQWFSEAPEQEKKTFTFYRGQDLDPDYANEVLMRMALESRADVCILPMQDILRLGAEGRMNTPSSAKGNWEWRLTDSKGWLPGAGQATQPQNGTDGDTAKAALPVPDIFGHVHFLCKLYGRLADEASEASGVINSEVPLV
jgi:4-alpha-glucanotransferase